MKTKTYGEYEFILLYSCDYSSLYYNAALKLAICTAEADYIPIEKFKAVFLSVSEQMETYPIQHLVFDKRNLRTFHQPSMEWYLAIWKPSVKAKGLADHYKILPDLEWFVQAVNAGKQEIFRKYDKALFAGIWISYVTSVEKAIEQVLNEAPGN